MVTVGLVGGIASGKSLVADAFQSLGACVLDGDKAGHEVLQHRHVIKKLVERWGQTILVEGEIQRSAVAKIVFSGSDDSPASSEPQQELAFLESVTHPAIHELLKQRIDQIAERGDCPVVVLDAAVMFKAGWDAMCDRIIYIDVPRDIRKKRAIERGMSAKQFEARESAQMAVSEKKERAQIIIDNSGTPQKTYKQVEEVWYSLLQIA